jgi:Na+-driven multidrug efflux pump
VWLGLVIGLAFAAFALIWRFVTHLGRSELPALVR